MAKSLALHLRIVFEPIAPHDRNLHSSFTLDLRSIFHGSALGPAVGLSELRPILARFRCS
jgi:hypothetical protein